MRSVIKKITGVVATALLAISGVTGIATPAQATACVSGTTASGALPAVELISQPQFFTGLGDGYNSNYIGYTIKNGSAAQSNLYVKLESFTGGSVALAANQPASQPSGPVAAGGSVTSFFLATASAVPTTTQTHAVVLFSGNPVLGGTEICRLTTSMTADAANTAAISANANKVNTITVGNTTGLTLGGTVAVTVRGQTGTISGSSGAISLSPASSSNFPAGAWRLISTSIKLNTTSAYASQAGTVTYSNRTFINNQAANGGYYEAVYTYKAVSTASAAAAIVPIQYINSGSLNMKYTGSLPATPSLLPIVNNSVTMTKSSNQSGSLTASGGVLVSTTDICYTIDLANGASLEAVVDQIADVHPAGTSYVAASAKSATASPSCSTGTSISPIVQSSDHRLVFEGPLTVPGNGHLYISYLIQFPAGLAEGVYNNSATAYISSTTLGASSIASVIVGVPPLYSISFDARDVNVANPSNLTQTSAGQSLNIGAVTPTRTGYNFGGWEDINGNDYPSSIIPSSNMTVYAIWTPVLYSVSFDLLGGTGNSATLTQASAGSSVQLYATGVTKTGYAFGGWSLTSGGTTAEQYAYTPTSNITVYAIWTAVYTISYDLLGGTGTSTTQSQSSPGASISLWQDATKSGYL
ncbi:MAG: InlB B-repeat-containing protein, partial [Rhodoluna sp.]